MSLSCSSNKTWRIKLSTNDPYTLPGFPLARQTPGHSACWQNFQFLINKPVEECDAWFIYDGLRTSERTRCPERNVVLITAEPPAYKIYPTQWLQQFYHVITSHSRLRHPRVRRGQTALPWFVQRSYDELATDELPPKTKRLSVICSTKHNMKGHRRRLAFLEALKKMDDLPIDFHGRGHQFLADKWDGLAPYQYSIAMENSVHPDYWTEKLTDCFLAGTVPIYYGCPNLDHFFPPSASEPIDIDDITGSIEKIRRLVTGKDYENRIPALRAARSLILNRYNLFPVIADCCRSLDLWAPKTAVSIEPEPPLGDWQRRLYKWRRRYLG